MAALIEDRMVYVVGDGDAGARLDRFLSERIQTLSRARLQDLIRNGRVTARGSGVFDPSLKVRPGQTYEITLPPPKPADLEAEAIPLNVVHEDGSLIVIDKPAGLVVHPGAGNPKGTLVNALVAHCGESLSGIGGVTRPGIVHRIDKDTSGLMVIAKTDSAHRELARQFADHGREGDLRREYLALVWGAPKQRAGRIEAQIARHSASRVKMTIVPSGGRRAITYYQTEQTYYIKEAETIGAHRNQKSEESPAASLIRCRLETGRTHQVRVHLAHIGTPIIGDPLYGAGFRTKIHLLPEPMGRRTALLTRQALHATLLRFRHPDSGKLLTFESDLPADIARMCIEFEKLGAKVSKN
jgi:23S rRNA pseudouridine1911/1915/1917 synthase